LSWNPNLGRLDRSLLGGELSQVIEAEAFLDSRDPVDHFFEPALAEKLMLFPLKTGAGRSGLQKRILDLS
jgi:hypothetical protein